MAYCGYAKAVKQAEGCEPNSGPSCLSINGTADTQAGIGREKSGCGRAWAIGRIEGWSSESRKTLAASTLKYCQIGSTNQMEYGEREDMSHEFATPSGRIVEEQLDKHMLAIQRAFGSDGLCYSAPLYSGADGIFRDAVENIMARHKVVPPKKRPKISVVLETPGGYAETAERIADTLHRDFDAVEFVVPNYAMSAGTILVMCGDEIWMDWFSVLGPIDPQIQGPKGGIPAHGYLIQYERLIEKSRKGKITTAELQFLIEKFDPAELYRYEQEMQLSVTLFKNWLVKYKFRNWNVTETNKRKVTSKMKHKQAELIAAKLNDTKKWHSHGRGISMECLRREVDLKIEDFGLDAKKRDAVREYHRLLSDYMAKLGLNAAVHVVGSFLPMRAGRTTS